MIGIANATLKKLYTIVGKPTTNNSKMTDTLCFNTTPARCTTGSKLRGDKSKVCSKCYSLLLIKFRRVVAEAYQRNYELLTEAMRNYSIERVAEILASIVYRKGKRKVRIKDGGDAVNKDEFKVWAFVALMCRDSVFWMPTKEHEWARAYLDEYRLPSNMVIRVSMHGIDEKPSKEFTHTSVVYNQHNFDTCKETRGRKKCPAKQQDNACLDCEWCWDPAVKTVVYPLT